jgi:hypothetical protein
MGGFVFEPSRARRKAAPFGSSDHLLPTPTMGLSSSKVTTISLMWSTQCLLVQQMPMVLLRNVKSEAIPPAAIHKSFTVSFPTNSFRISTSYNIIVVLKTSYRMSSYWLLFYMVPCIDYWKRLGVLCKNDRSSTVQDCVWADPNM